MSAIKTDFGAGGAGLTPKNTRGPTLAEALRDIADDLADIQQPALTASAMSAVAAITSTAASGGDSPTEAEYNALRVDVVALHARMGEVKTLLDEIRTDMNAMAAVTIRTTKA